MRTLLFYASVIAGVLVGGCMPQPIVEPQKPEPVVVKDYDSAAEAYVAHYRAGLSKAAAEVAASARSGAYADLYELNQDWLQKTKLAREASQKTLIDRMNANLSGNPSDKEVVEMFELLSKGWSGGNCKSSKTN